MSPQARPNLARLPVSLDGIERRIFFLRGHRVMLDSALAVLYGVATHNLNKAVKRNMDRFPPDFMFQLDKEEAATLRFQFGISKPGRRGGRRYRPYVFTEQGVAMLSSVLRSRRAVQVNIAIMRAFVRLRLAAAGNRELAERLAELERRLGRHDADIREIFKALRALMSPFEKPRRRIGFTVSERGRARYRTGGRGPSVPRRDR